MSELILRIIIIGLMIVTLLLPRERLIEPNFFMIYWYSIEALSKIKSVNSFSKIIGWYGILIYLWTVPILTLLNALLLIFPCRGLVGFYRFCLFILFLIIWNEVLFIMGPGRGIGYWAIPAVVTTAVVIEIHLYTRGRKSRRGLS